MQIKTVPIENLVGIDRIILCKDESIPLFNKIVRVYRPDHGLEYHITDRKLLYVFNEKHLKISFITKETHPEYFL